MNTPTRQPPSSDMPSFLAGVVPAKVQLNLVPLYFPATISPAPAQDPSIDWKKARSRSAAATGAAIAVVRATDTASGRILGNIARCIDVNPATELKRTT